MERGMSELVRDHRLDGLRWRRRHDPPVENETTAIGHRRAA
jgi:hypothetical protein